MKNIIVFVLEWFNLRGEINIKIRKLLYVVRIVGELIGGWFTVVI